MADSEHKATGPLKDAPSALFKLYGTHTVKVYLKHKGENDLAICDTCSLSQTAARAAIFAAQNGILKMTFDGADLVRT